MIKSVLKMFKLGELRVCSGSSFLSRTTEGKKDAYYKREILCNVWRPELLLKWYVEALPTVAAQVK